MKKIYFTTFYMMCVLIMSNCSTRKSDNLVDDKMTIIQDSKYISWITGKDFKSFKPSKLDINNAEEVLKKAINDEQFYFLKKKKISELKKNYRQYLCFLNEKDEKIIYINSFCKLFVDYDNDNKPIPFDWKNKMVDTSDGGECYWNVKINLSTNEYFELKINGNS